MATKEKEKPRVVGVGETVVDLILQKDGSFRPVVGGTPLNVVVGLSRQGFRTAILSPVSRDHLGKQIRQHIKESHVDASLLVETSAPTTIAVITFDETGKSDYECYVDGTSQDTWLPEYVRQPGPGDILVVSGSFALTKKSMLSAIDDVFEIGSKYHTIILDPNIRDKVIGSDIELAIETFENWASKSTIIKASTEDLQALYPGVDLVDIVDRLTGLGATMVVVTDGAVGAYAFTSNGAKTFVPSIELSDSELKDTIGAGDTCNAAMLEWLIENGVLNGDPVHDKIALAAMPDEQLEEMMGFAVERAAKVCKVIGADPPWKKGLGPEPVSDLDHDGWSEATRGR